jgi:hypothetical protein
MSRFRLNQDGSKSRYVVINDQLYEICVSKDEWETYGSTKISNSIRYWVSQKEKGKDPKLQFGTIHEVETIPKHPQFVCEECKRSYQSRQSYSKHLRTHHSPKEENLRIVANENAQSSTNEAQITGNENTQTSANESQISGNENNQVAGSNVEQSFNNHYHIAINNFGDENPKWLTPELLLKVISDLPTAIPKLIKAKHFNDQFPENQNIRIDDKRAIHKRLQVYHENRWNLKDRPDITNPLFSHMIDILELLFDIEQANENGPYSEIVQQLHSSQNHRRRIERTVSKWNEFQPKLDEDNKELIGKINDRLDTLLLDNQLKIKQLEERIKGGGNLVSP